MEYSEFCYRVDNFCEVQHMKIFPGARPDPRVFLPNTIVTLTTDDYDKYCRERSNLRAGINGKPNELMFRPTNVLVRHLFLFLLLLLLL